MKRFPKLLCLALVVFLPFYGVLSFINPGQWFRLDLNTLDISSTERQESYHVVGYGVDIEKAEGYYTGLKNMLGANYVNRKVYIYRANPKYSDGQIGKEAIYGIRYYGAYKQDVITGRDVIVYDGNDSTLIHELTHFFYNHMNRTHQDEAFAYINTAYINLLNSQQQLMQMMKLIAAMRATNIPKETTNV